MDLGKLKYFYAVARTGSFTAAANEIHVSQPSLSKMVKMLEEELGTRLFERGKKGVSLTAEGKVAFARCQNIFSELQAMELGLTEMRQELSGTLSIGASDNLCNYVLPGVLHEFLKNFPKVRVQLLSGTSSEIQAQLSEDKIECGLFYTKVFRTKEFEVKPLGFVEFALVANRELKLRELSEEPYIGSRKADYKGSYPALEMLESLGIAPKTNFETNNQETQKKMALLGSGFTVVPLHMVESEIRLGTLHRTKVHTKIGSMVSLVKKRGKNSSKVAAAFERALTKRLSGV